MTQADTNRGAICAAISNSIVSLTKSVYGVGPTQARAVYTDDIITCVLKDGLTSPERTLLEEGREGPVVEQRRALQDVLRWRLKEVVETHTGRKVVCAMSGHSHEPPMSCEVFVLAAREPA